MKYLFAFLSCLICEMGFAETIQNVEYHLPKAAENWVIGNKLENEKGTTIVYIPQEKERQGAREFFGVNANHLSSNPNNIDALKTSLTKMLPNMNVDFHVLEQDKDSVTYEWVAQDKGADKIHGWGRAFSNNEGTVVLLYQTEDLSNLSQTRSIWLQALKEAKQK